MDRSEEAAPDASDALIESVHQFPGPYQIKAIGVGSEQFVERIVAVVSAHLATVADLEHHVRTTPGGRHLAVTLDLQLQSASQVRAIYAALRKVEGLAMLL
jgi:putative lipoic acid-binding regulatory protein